MRCGLKLRCLKRGRARWRDKLQRTVRYCVPGKYYAEDTEVNHLLRQSNEETGEFDNSRSDVEMGTVTVTGREWEFNPRHRGNEIGNGE